MSNSYRKLNYYLYHTIFSLFILALTLFLSLDCLTGEFEEGSSLKYVITFFIFGTYLGGCAFFSRKISEDYHPLSLLYVLFSLIIIYLGSKGLNNYLNPETESVMNLKIPFYTLLVMEAAYIGLIKFEDRAPLFIVNIVVAVLSILAFYSIKEFETVGIIAFSVLTVISVIVATIRAIQGCEEEIKDSCLGMFW